MDRKSHAERGDIHLRILYPQEEELLTARTFTIVGERDTESGWLVGEVVGLPGCYTQAADRPSLEANIREAITAYHKIEIGDDPGYSPEPT